MDIINPSGKKTQSVKIDWLGRELSLEVNRVGFRTTSSVLVKYGDTVVLGSVVVGTKPVVQDFFPLSIEYEEKITKLMCVDCRHYDESVGVTKAFGLCQCRGERVRFTHKICEDFSDLRG